MRSVPTYAYWLGIVAGLFGLGLYLAILEQSNFADHDPLPLAMVICFVAGLLFGFFWPVGSWRWGIWVTSPFSVFLVLAFGSFLSNGIVEMGPLLEALALTVVASMASLVGVWLADQLKKRVTTPRPGGD